MKILLFGKNGQVGWELHRSLQPLGEIVALGRNDADFSDPESLRHIINNIKPDVIVNAVAYTAVDNAESEEDLATTINGTAPGVLAEEASKVNALLVHYSTDYIFDGTSNRPYLESDAPNPINAYGRSKLAGERAIQSSGCNFVILRTSWVYASRGSNFLQTIIRLAKEKNELKIIDDQIGTPTWARYIADSTSCLISKILNDQVSGNIEINEIFHLVNEGHCSWYQFADEIVSRLKVIDQNIKTEVKPISSDQYASVADRPKHTVLCTDKIQREMLLKNIHWDSAVELCIDECLC